MGDKALSLWQPWASLITLGHKTIETRSWPTTYRGRLWIHATKTTPPEDLFMAAIDDDINAALRFSGVRLEDLPRGALVGVCDLVDCVRTELVPPEEQHLGDFTPGRWAWVLEDCRRVDPIPMRGAQGLFEVPL